MAIASNFPAIRPSLNLDFANARALDPRITFSRASAATYYDGKTVAKAEENLLLRSQEFDQGPWEKLLAGSALAPVVTANAGTAPDGTATADRVVFSLNGGVSSGDISQLVQTLPLSGQYVFSVWLKSTDGSSTYNMQLAGAGAVADVTVTGTWQRFMVTGTYAAAYSNQLRLRGAQGVVNSNTADVLLWGAQLEQRSQVTAYTPTTTQPITNYIPVLQTAPAGVPRFDHNPVTGESLGLLVEEQRTNLLNYSEKFDDVSWSKIGTSVISNTVVAPDGTFTADTVVFTNGISEDRIDKTVNIYPTSGSVYTYSVWLKGSGTLKITVNTGDGTGGASELTVNLESAWKRYSVTHTFLAGVTGPLRVHGLIIRANSKPIVDIWGAQLEAGAFPTSYIKTEASQVTRAADSASMTGVNFSSWYRQDRGSLFAEFDVLSTYGNLNSRVAWFDDSTQGNYTNFIQLTSVGGSPNYAVAIGGSTQANMTFGGLSAGSMKRMAFAFKKDAFAATADGAAVSADTSGEVPYSINSVRIGCHRDGTYLNGHIKRIAYYTERLSDAQLQALTA